MPFASSWICNFHWLIIASDIVGLYLDLAIRFSFCERQTELVKKGHHYKEITVNNLLNFLFQEIKKKNNIYLYICIYFL